MSVRALRVSVTLCPVDKTLCVSVSLWQTRGHDRSVIPKISYYQANRRPNWAARPSSAVVMMPTVAFEMLASGLPKLL